MNSQNHNNNNNNSNGGNLQYLSRSQILMDSNSHQQHLSDLFINLKQNN